MPLLVIRTAVLCEKAVQDVPAAEAPVASLPQHSRFEQLICKCQDRMCIVYDEAGICLRVRPIVSM